MESGGIKSKFCFLKVLFFWTFPTNEKFQAYKNLSKIMNICAATLMYNCLQA